MTISSETVSLFTRGAESVRLVREDRANGFVRLRVYGPETEAAIHEFADMGACMKQQAEIEGRLLASGYQVSRTWSDRRGEPSLWSGPDHRRPAS
jgi:hypothetical protein